MNSQNYHRVENFPNGYGASIICRVQSYEHWDYEVNSGAKQGFFEVALLYEGEICYGHPMNEHAIFSHLNFGEVAKLLIQIEELPTKNQDQMDHE